MEPVEQHERENRTQLEHGDRNIEYGADYKTIAKAIAKVADAIQWLAFSVILSTGLVMFSQV